MVGLRSFLGGILLIGSVSCQGFIFRSQSLMPSGIGGLGGIGSIGGMGLSRGPQALTGLGGHLGGVTSGQASDVRSSDPPQIRQLLGSTVHGRELRMGELGLPRHGGAGAGHQHANGLTNGWDGNPATLGNRFQNSWTDPFGGRPIPPQILMSPGIPTFGALG